MINLDSITNENNKEHNEKCPHIRDHPYRILIIGGSGSGKANALFNLIKTQDDIDKIHLYAKDLSEPKYEFLIKNVKMLEQTILMIQMHLLSVQMDDVYQNIDNYNPNRKRKILIVFDDMIADIIKELFIRCRKLNISLNHSILLSFSKRCKIKFDTLFDYEN